MTLCTECRHSEIVHRGSKKAVRVCNSLEGKPMCINAREFWWDKENRERECGPEGKLFENI